MFTQFCAAATGFYADEAYLAILNELIKGANGIRPAAHAGDHSRRQTAFFSRICCFISC